MEDMAAGCDSRGASWPLPAQSIIFVDSPSSHAFHLFLRALDLASIVAMDAEWKPLSSSRKTSCTRVSVMQLAVRLRDEELVLASEPSILERPSSLNLYAYQLTRADVLPEGDCDSGSLAERSDVSCFRQIKGREFMERSLCRLRRKEELIFLLDMLSLPAQSFWEAMKKMLVSPSVLKLGFRFRQDLSNLAKTFPGPDAHSCFDKVDPYLDIGKLYREIWGWYDLPMESLSLATVCEKVLGYNLCKDLQCSDWEQRPLTMEQQMYAAADVHCLLVAYDILETEASKGFNVRHKSADTGKMDGIPELLVCDDLDYRNCDANDTIVHAYRGIASIMVRCAVSDGTFLTSDVTTSSTSNIHLLIARKFGERLLLNGEQSSKIVRRKPKNNKGHKVDPIESNWYGPPPWDPTFGGDGCPKFLCDNMVEGLAKQLRNVGIDTVCLRQKSDPRKLLEIAEKEGRILLTQDIKLLRRRLIPNNLAYRVKNFGKQEQLIEVIRTFNLIISEDNLLSRCAKCNGNFIPEPLTPEEALASVPDGQAIPGYAVEERLLFWQCSVCMHMYWQGNQFHRALQTFQAFARKLQMSQQQQNGNILGFS